MPDSEPTYEGTFELEAPYNETPGPIREGSVIRDKTGSYQISDWLREDETTVSFSGRAFSGDKKGALVRITIPKPDNSKAQNARFLSNASLADHEELAPFFPKRIAFRGMPNGSYLVEEFFYFLGKPVSASEPEMMAKSLAKTELGLPEKGQVDQLLYHRSIGEELLNPPYCFDEETVLKIGIKFLRFMQELYKAGFSVGNIDLNYLYWDSNNNQLRVDSLSLIDSRVRDEGDTVFQWCGSLYEMLTGEKIMISTGRVLNQPDKSHRWPNISYSLQKILAKGLHPVYECRYQTINELRKDLRDCLELDCKDNERLQQEAEGDEAKGEEEKALKKWDILLKREPNNGLIKAKVEVLKESLNRKRRSAFEVGRQFLEIVNPEDSHLRMALTFLAKIINNRENEVDDYGLFLQALRLKDIAEAALRDKIGYQHAQFMGLRWRGKARLMEAMEDLAMSRYDGAQDGLEQALEQIKKSTDESQKAGRPVASGEMTKTIEALIAEVKFRKMMFYLPLIFSSEGEQAAAGYLEQNRELLKQVPYSIKPYLEKEFSGLIAEEERYRERAEAKTKAKVLLDLANLNRSNKYYLDADFYVDRAYEADPGDLQVREFYKTMGEHWVNGGDFLRAWRCYFRAWRPISAPIEHRPAILRQGLDELEISPRATAAAAGRVLEQILRGGDPSVLPEMTFTRLCYALKVLAGTKEIDAARKLWYQIAAIKPNHPWLTLIKQGLENPPFAFDAKESRT